MGYRRVAVIGASGFIGRHVVKRLAARGTVVAAICRHAEEALVLQPMGDVGQIAPIRASITDEKSCAAALAGAEAIVNLAGILFERGRQTFDAAHREGPERLGRLAAAHGVRRLVHLSALGADIAAPSSYGRSKAAGESALRAVFPQAVILRPAVVFGPEDDFFNRFARMAQLLPVLPLFGGGATRMQPVYVCDVADAVMRCLDDAATAGKTYELGGPHIYTMRQIMELVLAMTRRHRPLISVPWSLARPQAAILEAIAGVPPLSWVLPAPPLTRDQLRMLERDSVVSEGALALADLGIAATAAEAILPAYLDCYRRGGWFGSHRLEV